MAEIDEWGPSTTVQSGSGYNPVRPRLGFTDLVLHLWRAKWVMMLVAMPIFIMGFIVALSMPKEYESFSRLYVRAGDELRLSSVVADTSRDTLPDLEQIVKGELELLRSPIVIERTLDRFDLERLYPKLYEAAIKQASAEPASALEAIRFEFNQKAMEAFSRKLQAGAAPKTPVINISFAHENRHIAAEVLNATMATYLDYRSQLFGTRPVAKFSNQRERIELELLRAEEAIKSFLSANNIGDFESERATAQTLFGEASSALFTAEARASALDGQLASTRSALNDTPQQQDLFVEDTSAQALRDLEIQRNQALVNYLPNSQTVQAIEKQIDELKSLIEAQDSLSGTTRRGPNPTYQALEATLNTLEAEGESLAGQRIELSRQLAAVEARLQRFTDLEPRWNELQRNRDLLANNVRIVAEREQQEDAIAGIASEEVDSVTVMEPATIALRGSSMRLPIALLALIFAGFTALMVGLLRTFTARGFISPRSLQRTVALPVLGVIGKS